MTDSSNAFPLSHGSLIYTENNRGEIQCRDRAKQLISFKDIRIGNITPTDLDGMIEYKDKLFIFIEIKREGVALPRGQELCFTRICDSLSKPSILFVCTHCVDDPTHDIYAAECIVHKVYEQGKWHEPNRQINLKEAVNIFIERIDCIVTGNGALEGACEKKWERGGGENGGSGGDNRAE